MQQISGTVAVVHGGTLIQQAPLRPVTLSLPGRRRGTAYTVGHLEPVTLHRSHSPSGNAANLMVITPGTVAYLDVLRSDIDRGRLTNESAAADLAKPTLRRALRSMAGATKSASPGSLPLFFAAATGAKGNAHLTVLAHLAGGSEVNSPTSSLMANMAEATGIPLALGLSQLVDGTAARPGVHAPETVIDPDRFFQDLDLVIGRGTGRGSVLVECALTETLPRR
ncbi:hypothetical protein [Rhodococcus sp. OK302]|uniref:hypothetical protein n=1 Tax=Rhodococcus sp. OK302 TaxID=1882769 RepID=UPI000B93BE16|nr:hypothetical protein [Rhodococcus sp. OK302]